MKTNAMRPIPRPSVRTTPNPSASQPAPLISESPMPNHKLTTTKPTAAKIAAAIAARG